MKKLICILSLMLILTSCTTVPSDIEDHPLEDRLELIYVDSGYTGHNLCGWYYRDTHTDVIYIYLNSTNGGITPLLNSDGTPCLWSELKEETH